MNEPSTLGEVIDAAAARHNGASGRRLAEIARKAGFTLSHATINRLRRGDIGETITEATLGALASLSGLSVEAVRTAAATQAGVTQNPEALFREYARLSGELIRVTFDYSRARGIDMKQAQEELEELQAMAYQLKDGRPWTPPWAPLGDAFGSDDTPWIERWWSTPAAARYRRRSDELLRDRLYGQVQSPLPSANYPEVRDSVLNAHAGESPEPDLGAGEDRGESV